MPKRKQQESSSKKTNKAYDFNKLTRSSSERIIGGVCGGIADFFNVDVTLIRLIFAVMFVFGGSGFLLYFILWVILPSDKYATGISEENIKLNAEEIRAKANEFSKNFSTSSRKDNSKKLFGLILLFLGFSFLFSNFGIFSFHWIGKLWPLILIFLAFAILTNDGK